MNEKTFHIALMLVVAGLYGCATDRLYIPSERSPARDHEPATIETGVLIPRGKEEKVRDTSQNVDVYSEEELEDDRPANTGDAVRRAIRGR